MKKQMYRIWRAYPEGTTSHLCDREGHSPEDAFADRRQNPGVGAPLGEGRYIVAMIGVGGAHDKIKMFDLVPPSDPSLVVHRVNF